MKPGLKYKRIVFLIVLLIIVIISIITSLTIGEKNIPVFKLPVILLEKQGIQYTILSRIRLPRLILGFAVGGALSLSGAILQGVFRNPLVEPYTLGISGGASLGIAICIVFSLPAVLGASVLPAAGFAGALLMLLFVYWLSAIKSGLNINSMLLIGVMASFVASSATMFLMSVTTTENVHSIVFWVMGSLDEPNPLLIKIAIWSSLAGLVISYFFARPLNALCLGEVKAGHLGINTTLTIRVLFIIASLLTGISVAVAGVVGFVGLVIPHLMRLLIGNDFRVLLISSFLGGASFLLFCDVIARTIISPNELPVGVITGIAGGIVFILVLRSPRFKKLN